MIKFFNINSIKDARATFKTTPSGFRYGFIPNIFNEDAYQKLAISFPDVNKFKLVDKQSGGGRKRFYTGPAYDANKNPGCVCYLSQLPDIWRGVLKESASPEFIARLKDSTALDFNTMCTFGFTYGNEGCLQEPHLDGAVREGDKSLIHSTIACLLYINENPNGESGTCLYDTDRKTILSQVINMRNGLFFFEQHPDAWHGFPLMPAGAERRLVSLAYSKENSPIDLKTSLSHRLICIPNYKRLIKKLLK